MGSEMCIRDSRRSAAKALSSSSNRAEVKSKLINSLGDSHPDVREAAAWSLPNAMQHEDVRLALMKAVGGKCKGTRVTAVRKLAKDIPVAILFDQLGSE